MREPRTTGPSDPRGAAGRLAAAALPSIAVVAFAVGVAATIAVAGDTLGYDFTAYHRAAVRVLAGAPAYDQAYQVAGPYGLFLYPPTFVPLVLALGLLPLGTAIGAWTALLVACFAAAVVAMPVRTRTRWWVVLLAAQSWPFLYGLKLGQVGPVLLLLFALGWRGLSRPAVLGVTGALGAAIKIQPGIVLAWAVLTRRWGAVAAGVATLVALSLVATVVAGPGSWTDFAGLLGRVSDPVTTPHNFTPGAVAFQLGLARDAAALLQWAAMGLVVAVVVGAALALDVVASFLIAVVASQLLSPILWDHYAVILLLPVAWLLDRGHAWAALVPVATSVVLVGILPPVAYPLVFGATIIGLVAVGVADRRRPSGRTAVAAAGA